jgi:myo-inositol-1(or 4)-monophosphatase
LIELAIRIAREAGAILLDFASRDFIITNKGRINLVTEADHASEAYIKTAILEHYPDHQILAEESGVHFAPSDYVWIIDPLDGTTNFAHGVPCYAVSIGIEHRGSMIAGVIYDPSNDHVYAAERGGGAFRNGQRINTSKIEHLEQALLVSGFPYDVREQMNAYLPAWEAFLASAQGVRRLGAASIDMCYVACGYFDGFWEFGLNAWDTAAGWLLIEEAGGKVTKGDGTAFRNADPDLLATNGLIHDQMMDVLRQVRNKGTLEPSVP